MARISDITLPSGTSYDIGTSTGAEFIYGTQTGQTNAWTGVTTDSELYDGKEIIYFLPFGGTSNASTLNLTLSTGSTTGAKAVYFNSTTRHTTHYGQYQMIRMVYHASLTINSTTYSGWWIDYAKDTNDNSNKLYQAAVEYKAKTVIYRYQICLTVDEVYVLPINTVSNNTGTSKTLTTVAFNPFAPIYYYNSDSTISSGSTINGGRLYGKTTLDLRYSFNTGKTLTEYKAVYMVCTPQSNGSVKLYSSPITQTLPTSNDGLYYVYLGQAYSTYQLSLSVAHPVYMYKNGAVREISQYAVNAGSASYDASTETITINL